MAGFGTNEAAIYAALRAVNGPGLKLIFNAFGVRDVPWGFGIGQNMYEWFLNDLSDHELDQVRLIWENAGLVPPF